MTIVRRCVLLLESVSHNLKLGVKLLHAISLETEETLVISILIRAPEVVRAGKYYKGSCIDLIIQTSGAIFHDVSTPFLVSNKKMANIPNIFALQVLPEGPLFFYLLLEQYPLFLVITTVSSQLRIIFSPA